MSNLPLGQIITTEQERDAIHVAVAPVEAGEWLAPGHHVRIAASGLAVAAPQSEAIGIVDPFLKQHVLTGERFWLFLYPGSITSLRHDWSHPAFDSSPKLGAKSESVKNSEAWLRDFAETVGRTYADLLAMATEAEGRCIYVGSDTQQDRFNDTKEVFFKHLSIVTGKQLDAENIQFSCAC